MRSDADGRSMSTTDLLAGQCPQRRTACLTMSRWRKTRGWGTLIFCGTLIATGCTSQDNDQEGTPCEAMASLMRLADAGVNGDEMRPHMIEFLDRKDLSKRMGNAAVQIVIAIDRHEEIVSEESIAAYNELIAAYDAECPAR